tara:strand:+ start:20682 stop:26600 length:5919 start_codon:yes stop_codon:yes gene_type:complete
MFRRSRGNKKSRRVGDTSFGAGGTFGGNTGTPTRTGMMLNLGAGAAGQLERLKQIQPKPAPIKIVRVPTAAIVSSPPSRRVAIPPAPPVLPPPRVNPPPRSKFKGDNFEPLVRPQIVTQAQINPKQRERNMALQPRSEFVPPRNPIVKSFSPNIIPRPFAFNTNPMVVPPRNIPTKPIAIGGPSYLVRGLPSDKAFTDEVVANTSGGSLNEGLQPMAVLMDEYDAKANEIRNNPFATQNTGQLEQEVINQIGEKPILTKPPIKTLPKPDPIPPRPKPIIPNDDFNLSVNSDPTGADIFLDGAKVGTTGTILKLPMKSLQGVTKKLTAKLTGYTSRLGTDACYYTISGVATTIQIKENFDVFEDPDDFFDERIMLGPNSFNNFGGQGSPEGYGRNNFLRGQERLDTLGRGTGAYGPAAGSLSRTNIRKRITKTRLKNVDKYIVVIKKYELGKEVSAPPIAGNLANLNFQFKKLIIDIKDDDVKDDYPKDVKDPPKPIEPELLIVSKGGRMDTFRVSAKGNGSTVTNSAGNYKSANSFDITITQVDGYNIKGFGILKGQIDDQPDAPSMEKLDLNELNISVGGKMTIYIDWGDQIKIVKPSVRLNNSSYTLNTAEVSAGMGGVTIGYLSENADNIKLQLRKTTRNNNLEAGTFSLNPNVFSEGVGQYVGYIIPSNSGYGDGDKVRFVVNVISKSYLPGPDIINITYPSLVKGADFRGLDVNFSIGYESINTSYVNISVGAPDIFYGKFGKAQAVDFNVGRILKLAGDKIKDEDENNIKFSIFLTPFNTATDKVVKGKVEELAITFDKGNLTLPRPDVVERLCSAFSFDYTTFDEETSKYLTHLAHFGDGDNKLITTWETDDVTFVDYAPHPITGKATDKRQGGFDSLVLKLYEPLDKSIQPNSPLFISKIITPSTIEEISIIDDAEEYCVPLKGPNFGVNLCGTPSDMGYTLIDELVDSGSQSSAMLINTFVSKSGIDTDKLEIEYVSSSYDFKETDKGWDSDGTITENYSFDNFSHFGSAEERSRNFYYKVSLLEIYSGSLNNLNNAIGSATSSLSVIREKESIQKKINDVTVNLDGFEKFLYESTSSLAYPKKDNGVTLQSTGSQNSVAWFNQLIVSSSDYDSLNENYLVNNIPEFVAVDSENDDYKLFLQMIGHHFDIIWSYIKGLESLKTVEEKHRMGVTDDMLKHVLKNYSWIPASSKNSAQLWEYALGYRDSNQTSKLAKTGKEYENTIWRRILNNLPYLLKHKGTRRGISALLTTYGIPSSLLTIMEFGGPRNTESQSSTFTFDDRTAAAVFQSDYDSKVNVDWNVNNAVSSSHALEFRVKTNEKNNQTIISNEPHWNIGLEHKVSTLGRLFYSSSEGYVYTHSGSLFNNEYTQIGVNVNYHTASQGPASASIDLFAAQDSQGRIRMEVTGSTTGSFNNVDTFFSGSQISLGDGFTGSMDEFRIWSSALSESILRDHTFMPDKTNGNHISSSTEDLELRLDFEKPENLNVSTSITNIAVKRDYGTSYATASNFQNITEYPYNFEIYERQVTAKVPSVGFAPADKFRFETQTLDMNLSYRQRSTKKSFDKAPIDSNKLGIFLSPTKELNMDIIKSLPDFVIDDYIGDPNDLYKDHYPSLDKLRDYVFGRYDLNIYEYINLIKYIDKSMFETLHQLIPARVKLIDGLLIEPHFLERNKVENKEIQASLHHHSASIGDIPPEIQTEFIPKEAFLHLSESISPIATIENIEGVITDTTIETLTVDIQDINAKIVFDDTNTLEGVITRNSGSDMAGFSIEIDAQNTGSVSSEIDSFTEDNIIGLSKDSLSVAGFSLGPGTNGFAHRTRIDVDNNMVKEKVKVFLVKKSRKFKEKVNVDSNDSSLGKKVATKIKEFSLVTIQSPSGSAPNVGDIDPDGTVVQVTPYQGYFPTHYRNTGDLTTGMENSYFRGSKQTQATTLDGTPPIEIFTTNPNTLKVSDSGRGSGEPILEVE